MKMPTGQISNSYLTDPTSPLHHKLQIQSLLLIEISDQIDRSFCDVICYNASPQWHDSTLHDLQCGVRVKGDGGYACFQGIGVKGQGKGGDLVYVGDYGGFRIYIGKILKRKLMFLIFASAGPSADFELWGILRYCVI